MFQQLGKQKNRKHVLAIVTSMASIGMLLVVGIWVALSGVFRGALADFGQTSTKSIQVSQPVSPLLFGTNLGLFNSNDQVLTSATTRNLLQQMHVRIMRMPVRSSLSEATEIQAAQTIKNLGAMALVTLRGEVDANVLADDTTIINGMNSVFGNSVVYYEYGNEEDLLGVKVDKYTASWNAVIPKLKQIALNGQFIGPVNFQYDRTYLTTFLQNANPRPDEVSWHEYTCDDSWASDICISHIDHWTNHISDARSAMTATIGTALPIMITEWNYAPNAVPNDGKNNDSTFMSTWTSKALQTLADNGIFAAMQYSCTNTAIPLIDSGGSPTAQGKAFQGVYEQKILGGQQSTPTSTVDPGQTPTQPTASPSPDPQPTTSSSQGPQSTASLSPDPQPTTSSSQGPQPSIVPNTKLAFSFEDGTIDGWGGHGSEVTGVQNSGAVAFDGKQSLQVTLHDVIARDFPYVSVGGSGLTNYPQAGQTITAYVYLPGNSVSVTAKLFIMDSQYHWFSGNMMRLSPGEWNRLTFTVPSNVSGQLLQLGIQFSTLGNTAMSTDVYIDAVGWS